MLIRLIQYSYFIVSLPDRGCLVLLKYVLNVDSLNSVYRGCLVLLKYILNVDSLNSV